MTKHNKEQNHQQQQKYQDTDFLDKPTLFMGTYGTYLKSYIKLEKKIKKFFSKFNN